MGEHGVELLAEILEPVARPHFGEDVLDSPIGFGGVANLVENSSRSRRSSACERGDDTGRLRDAVNLFGITPWRMRSAVEVASCPECARRGCGVCRRGSRGVDRGRRAGVLRGELEAEARASVGSCGAAKRVEDVPEGEAAQKGLRG